MVFSLFRDNGITIQMLKYQIATEIFMMIIFLLFVLEVGWVGNIMRNKIFDSVNIFVMYCIQPLFILNGDVNFRDRVLRHGFLNALKTELLFWWIFNSCNKWDEVKIKVHTYLIIPTNIYMIQFTSKAELLQEGFFSHSISLPGIFY